MRRARLADYRARLKRYWRLAPHVRKKHDCPRPPRRR